METLKQPFLFSPPPYCRQSEKQKHEIEALPSLELIVSNPSKLLTLYEKLHDNASKTIEKKINSYLMKEADCASTFLINLLPFSEEALVQTVGNKELEDTLRFPLSRDIMAQLVQCENEILKCDNSLNPQIVAIFEKIFDNTKLKIITVPILKKQTYYQCATQNIKPALLACFVESKKEENFIAKIANELFRFCLPVLINTLAAEEEARQRKQYQTLLDATCKFCSHIHDIYELITVITNETKKLTNAQKCSIFLVNLDDLLLISRKYNTPGDKKSKPSVKLALHYAIPDHVATTGTLINSHKHPESALCNENSMEIIEFRNFLCFPIKNGDNVIGAIHLYNKRKGNFTRFDEDIANILSVHCGFALSQSLKFTQFENFKIRSQLVDNLMIRHEQVNMEEVMQKISCPLIHQYPNFELFSFSPRSIVSMETTCLVFKMFERLGFLTTFGIKREVFAKFTMTVKNCCREVPYHNWMHLFSTVHFAYLCLTHLQLVEDKYITQLEALAYFVTCLCHDVDYRAANSSFQQTPSDVLCTLYSSPGSVMERHRLSQILRILNSEGCNFVEILNRENYKLFVDLLKDLTLATDLAIHFKHYTKKYNMTRSGYDRNNPEHRYVFTTLLVTCADLSDHAKDWTVSKTVTIQLFKEFFTQGDLEINYYTNPLKMKDTELVYIPDLLVNFLRDVCLPAFKMLAVMFVEIKELVQVIKRNILYWEASKHLFLKALDSGRSCLELLQTEEFDKDVEAAVQLLGTKNN
ncbi:cGMP-dependent 3',5'-cyclic phosphodiesterase-like [Tribolium madens]|uniref:cGMP-dependent 3',5'-cyclic phosphodiesterase-like n=1 Tax=Tribolium madens TaxID=41895 RepID=UPI001CF7298F|nr:cGMP-dependent 3',5'-cyclic phosphodiesterase-like [Tribolium madens]XP_044267885.1 cGMP-dependent 3',5'-cyclic phosphodiesterase-like [Tribolium madens]